MIINFYPDEVAKNASIQAELDELKRQYAVALNANSSEATQLLATIANVTTETRLQDSEFVELGLTQFDLDGVTPIQDSDNGWYQETAFALRLSILQTNGLITEETPFEQYFTFPVNPEEFSGTNGRSFGTYDILNAPQAMQLGTRALKTFTFSSFLPLQFDPDYCIPKGFPLAPLPQLERSPEIARDWLLGQMNRPAPMWLTSVEHSLNGSITPIRNKHRVAITNFTWNFRHGHPGDIFYDIELTECPELTVTRIKGGIGGVIAPTHKFKVYTTKKGDTLGSIARAAYGKTYASLWKQIKAKNKTVVKGGKKQKLTAKNPKAKSIGPITVLQVGQKLAIPAPTVPNPTR